MTLKVRRLPLWGAENWDATAKPTDPRPELHVAATNDSSWSVLREDVVVFLHDRPPKQPMVGISVLIGGIPWLPQSISR